MTEKGEQKKIRIAEKNQVMKKVTEHTGIIRRAIHIPMAKKVISGRTSPILPAGQYNRLREQKLSNY